MGMIVSAPTLMASSSGGSSKYSRFLSGRAYASDNRGNIFAVSFEKEGGGPAQPPEWSIKTAATLQPKTASGAGTGKNFAVPHGVALKKDSGAVWLIGGTANAGAKKDGMIVNGDGKIGQMLFSIRTPEKAAPEDGTVYRDSLTALDPRAKDSATPNGNGWYIPLDTAAASVGKIAEDEYVTARPALLGKKIYATTFTMSGISVEGLLDICNASKSGIKGYSRIYSLDYKSGSPSFSGLDGSKTRYIEIEGAKITGVTTVRNDDGGATLIFTYDMLTKNPFEKEEFKKLAEKNGLSNLGDGKFAMRVDKEGEQSGFPPSTTLIYYWIEK
jgi:hypothetical protein